MFKVLAEKKSQIPQLFVLNVFFSTGFFNTK